ncbi:MAG: DUF3147 family protein [Calditrichia bacterium]|nr:DUF3147 family protein [Calditrichia bacterium]
MDKMFFIKVVISFIVSGIWIAAATLFAERFGSKIGGLFSNLPSNILISLLFIALVNDVNYVVNAVPGIPIGMAINTLFLFFFVILLPYGLVISTIVSLTIWFLFASLASFLNFTNFFINVIIYLIITLIAFLVLEKIIKMPSVKKSTKKYTKIQMLLRVIFAGSTVSSVIIISKFFNPYIVGIFSTFPAVLLSTMVILTINQNKEFAQATGKILILSSSNIVIYGLAVYFTYPILGIVYGTIISFIIAFLWVWMFMPVVRRVI